MYIDVSSGTDSDNDYSQSTETRKDSIEWGGDNGRDSAFSMFGLPQFQSRGRGRMFMSAESQFLYSNEIPWTIPQPSPQGLPSFLCDQDSPSSSRALRNKSFTPRLPVQLASLPSHSPSVFGKSQNWALNPFAFLKSFPGQKGRKLQIPSTSPAAGQFSQFNTEPRRTRSSLTPPRYPLPNLSTQSLLPPRNEKNGHTTTRAGTQSPYTTTSQQLFVLAAENVLDLPKHSTSTSSSENKRKKRFRHTSHSSHRVSQISKPVSSPPPVLSRLVKTSGTGGTCNLKKQVSPPPPRIKIDWEQLQKSLVTSSPPAQSLSFASDLGPTSEFLPMLSEVRQLQRLPPPTPEKADQNLFLPPHLSTVIASKQTTSILNLSSKEKSTPPSPLPQDPYLSKSALTKSPTNDCELIGLELPDEIQYVRFIETELKKIGLQRIGKNHRSNIVDLSDPAFIEDVETFGSPIVVVFSSPDLDNKTLTVYLTKGHDLGFGSDQTQKFEHMKVPLAIVLIKAKLSRLKKKGEYCTIPEDVKFCINRQLSGEFMEDKEYKSIIQFFQKQWRTQRFLENKVNYDADTGILTKEELQEKVFEIIFRPVQSSSTPSSVDQQPWIGSQSLDDQLT